MYVVNCIYNINRQSGHGGLKMCNNLFCDKI